ncbi:24083_t:CDS:2 [Gigaspora rosea]|nr:24083_t:CDS:2 [Gigaspora rosea]
MLAIDFGTTYSGFAYASMQNLERITNSTWPGLNGRYKNNTVLKYDERFNVEEWGFPALVQQPSKRELIKETIDMHWPNINFMKQTLLIMTVPAEFDHCAFAIVRQCAYKADLIPTLSSEQLNFSTERDVKE